MGVAVPAAGEGQGSQPSGQLRLLWGLGLAAKNKARRGAWKAEGLTVVTPALALSFI